MKKKSIDIESRRDFLFGMGTLTGSLCTQMQWQFLLQALHQTIFKSKAKAAGSTRRYVFIQQAGAPSRWTFDLLLTPYGNSNFQANGHVGTRYQNATPYSNVEFVTVQKYGINVPWLWQFNVPKAGGGTRPMDELLKYFISVRGFTTGDPGHPGSQARHFRPLGAVTSIGGMVADGSNDPIPALNISCSFFDFKSALGKSSVTLNTNNQMLADLLKPFLSATSATFEQNKDKISSQLQNALSKMSDSAKSYDRLVATLEGDRQSAESLLENGFPGYTQFWTTTLAKYQDLIKRAIDPTQVLAGINDRAIGVPASQRNSTYVANQGANIQIADLRNLITANTVIRNMAEHFTVAEYVLKENLSHFIAISPREFGGLAEIGFLGFDEHGSGRMPVLYLNSMYNRAFAACLLEFIDKLKTNGIFNETVINCAGEFNRSPRGDGSGSDHGWEGASMALYSGAFEGSGPLVVGNIKRNGRGLGTWGYGSDNMPGLNRQLHLGDMAATLAFLLNGKNPVTAASSVIKEEGGKYVPIFAENAKITDS